MYEKLYISFYFFVNRFIPDRLSLFENEDIIQEKFI